MGHPAPFLQVPCTPASPRSQKFLAFPDFMEEVRSSWDHPASGPSVLNQAAVLASLEGVEKLGLAGFPPVDSTIAALVKAPPLGGLARDPACLNPQCKVTETHLKQVYAAEVQATRLSNMTNVLTVYMDGVLREAPLPEQVAMELRLLSSTLLQISGLQGTYLWANRGGDLIEIPLGMRGVPAGGRAAPSPRFCVGQVEPLASSSDTDCHRTVPVPMVPLGDLRHRLQGTQAANNQAQPAGRGNAIHGQPTHQRHRRHFQGQRPKQPPKLPRRSLGYGSGP
ncbi:UNVERIFIED_CONTAM: hypothetical protein FKN15_058485 [Acipenser sinensis]